MSHLHLAVQNLVMGLEVLGHEARVGEKPTFDAPGAVFLVVLSDFVAVAVGFNPAGHVVT